MDSKLALDSLRSCITTIREQLNIFSNVFPQMNTEFETEDFLRKIDKVFNCILSINMKVNELDNMIENIKVKNEN